MLTCAIISLGCPKNLVDSEQMLGLLQVNGLEPVYDVEDADVVIVNTCGFLAASRDEAMENIQEMEALRHDPDQKLKCLIVAGCLVTRDKAALIEACPGVDAFLDVFSRDSVLEAVQKTLGLSGDFGVKTPENVLPIVQIDAQDATAQETAAPEPLTFYGHSEGIASDPHRFPLLPPHVAYLKIAEGCNRRCAFCAIPNIRGKYSSKPMDEIVEEARNLAKNGVKEVILIAQETSLYGIDLRNPDGSPSENTLANLLRRLNEVEGIHWIRIQYLYPQDFGDDLIDAMATTPKVVPYADIPLQHINDRVLKSMRRAAGREETLALLARLRERIPNLAIRTAFIAGFPGETKAEFEELLAFVRKQKFDHVAVFQFSPEEGTPAAEMPNQVPEKMALKRTNELLQTQKRISAELRKKQIGQTLEVLIDMESDEEGTWLGHTAFGAPEIDGVVYVSLENEDDEPLKVGEFYQCEIVDCDEYDLFAIIAK